MELNIDDRRTARGYESGSSRRHPDARARRAEPPIWTGKPAGYESTCLHRAQSPLISRRFAIDDVEIRGAGGGLGVSIRGYAAIFNSPSLPMGKGSNRFTEKVAPGAFARALAEGADVRALWDHDTAGILGRTTSGTLRMHEDRNGLAFECDLPNTQVGRDAEESIRRGDVNGMSFGFRCVRDDWGKDADGNNTRTLLEVEPFDVSPTPFPAYSGTSVQLYGAAGGMRSIAPDLEDRRRRLLHHERLMALDGYGPIADMARRRRQLDELAGTGAANLNNHRRRICLALMD